MYFFYIALNKLKKTNKITLKKHIHSFLNKPTWFVHDM